MLLVLFFVSRRARALFLLAIFCLGICSTFRASSQALPAATYAVNRAIGAAITNYAVRKGFAANDPKIAQTLTAATSTASSFTNTASTVAGIGLAVAGAPVWLGVAASLGVLAVGTAMSISDREKITLGADKNIKYAIEPIAPSLPTYSAPTYSPPTGASAAEISVTNNINYHLNRLKSVALLHRTSDCKDTMMCKDFPLLPKIPVEAAVSFYVIYGLLVFFPTVESFAEYVASSSGTRVSEPAVFETSLINVSLKYDATKMSDYVDISQKYYAGGVLKPEFGFSSRFYVDKPFGTLPPVVSYTSSAFFRESIFFFEARSSFVFYKKGVPLISTSTNINEISEYHLASNSAPVPPKFIADLSNAILQKSALTDKTISYSVSDPITEADIAPNIKVGVSDLVAPAKNFDTNSTSLKPSELSSFGPVSNVGQPNTTTSTSVDFGPDPSVPAPTLEDTPTAKSILDPFLKLFPTFKSFAVPAHTAACPKPTFNVFNKNFEINSHCEILESIRPEIISFMNLVFVAISIFIVMSA